MTTQTTVQTRKIIARLLGDNDRVIEQHELLCAPTPTLEDIQSARAFLERRVAILGLGRVKNHQTSATVVTVWVYEQESAEEDVSPSSTQRHETMGRTFAVLAKFPYTGAGIKASNEFMLATPSAAVLQADEACGVVLADKADKGEPVLSQEPCDINA
ncbi:MAG: hypothetical protein KA173_15725 [Rhodoferax sp.]|nr:hypothetical protein [Rhodoferax sp.]